MRQIDWERAMEAPPKHFHERVQTVLYALPEQEEQNMKTFWNLKRVGALALAAVLVLSIGVAAASNFGYIRSDSKNSHTLKTPAAVEEVLEGETVDGLTADAKFLEAYSNGFTFVSASLEGTEARADDDPAVYHYQSVMSQYERDGAVVYVDISPVLPGITDRFEGETVECGDVTLYAAEQNYLVVPPDYEKTPEEEAAEAAGALVFSYDDGLEGPQAVTQRYVSWQQDGMRYSVNGMDSMTELSELTAMARELINA